MIVRANREELDALINMGLDTAVVVNNNEGLRLMGAIEAVFYLRSDAKDMAKGLCKSYGLPKGFIVVDLNKTVAGEA